MQLPDIGTPPACICCPISNRECHMVHVYCQLVGAISQPGTACVIGDNIASRSYFSPTLHAVNADNARDRDNSTHGRWLQLQPHSSRAGFCALCMHVCTVCMCVAKNAADTVTDTILTVHDSCTIELYNLCRKTYTTHTQHALMHQPLPTPRISINPLR